MADIIDLIGASQLHILRWQARLGEMRRGDPVSAPELAITWDTVAALIDLHMRGDDEVCAPVIYDPTPQGRALVRESIDAHADIGEMAAETSLQPVGAPLWWHLANITLAAWSRQCDYEERGPVGECRRRADPRLRQQLGGQWRAFREASIRDQSYPDAPPQQPTCQLRLGCPATPHLAEPAFCPLSCTCKACADKLAGIQSFG